MKANWTDKKWIIFFPPRKFHNALPATIIPHSGNIILADDIAAFTDAVRFPVLLMIRECQRERYRGNVGGRRNKRGARRNKSVTRSLLAA